MNNKQHVHVEAALVSLIVVVLLGLIDWFIDVYDGHHDKSTQMQEHCLTNIL